MDCSPPGVTLAESLARGVVVGAGLNRSLLLFLFVILPFESHAVDAVANLPGMESGKCLIKNLRAQDTPTAIGSDDFVSKVSTTYANIKALGLKHQHLDRIDVLGFHEKQGLINCGGVQAQGCNDGSVISLTGMRASGRVYPHNHGLIAHEMAHAFDQTPEAQAIASKPCASRVSSYAGTNAREAFAEIFAAYVNDPEYLKSRCPEAYQAIASSFFSGTPATCQKDARAALARGDLSLTGGRPSTTRAPAARAPASVRGSRGGHQ